VGNPKNPSAICDQDRPYDIAAHFRDRQIQHDHTGCVAKKDSLN
jgi:hypothetical protein